MNCEKGRHPRLFRRFVQQSVAVLLEDVAQAGHVIVGDLRERALHTLGFGLRLADAWPTMRLLLREMAPKMEQAGERQAWIGALAAGVAQARALEDVASVGELSLHLGGLYRLLGNYAEAHDCFAESQQAYLAVDDRQGWAMAMNRLAYVARLRGRYDEAIGLADEARAAAAGDDQVLAASYSVLGAVAFDQHEWPRALTLCTEAQRHWRAFAASDSAEAATRGTRMVAWSLRNLGPVLRALARYDKAIDCYREAQVLFAAIDDV